MVGDYVKKREGKRRYLTWMGDRGIGVLFSGAVEIEQ